MNDFSLGKTHRDTISRLTPGQDTIRRFGYQFQYGVQRWLECLDDPTLSVITELDEDLEVLSADVSEERIQVKTATSGSWTISGLLPLLARFYEQFKDNRNVSFVLVSNIVGATDVSRVISAIDRWRAGAPVPKIQQGSADRIARGLGISDEETREFLLHLKLDLGTNSLDGMADALRVRLNRACNERYSVNPSPEHIDSILDRLVGIMATRSGRIYLGDRTLASEELDSILREETTRIPLSAGVNIVQMGRNIEALVSHLADLPSQSSAMLGTPAAVAPESQEATEQNAQDEVDGEDRDNLRTASGLSSKDETRLAELEAILADKSRPLVLRIRAEQRMELARLLWEAGRSKDAEEQCAAALEESKEDSDALNFLVHDCANFFARRVPQTVVIEPYLAPYFDAVISTPRHWVDAAEVALFATARGLRTRGHNYVIDLRKRLLEEEVSEAEPMKLLRWSEALMILGAFAGECNDSVSHARKALALIDVDASHDLVWFRRQFLLLERLLRDAKDFDLLLSEFSAFYERKEAWSERAELHKAIGVARYKDNLYDTAIPMFQVAAEGYFKAGAYKGYLLASMMAARCFETSGRPLAALTGFLAAASEADLLNERLLGLQSLGEAIPIGFNELEFKLDALLWTISYCRLASVVGSPQQVADSRTMLDGVFALLAQTRSVEDTNIAKVVLRKSVTDSDEDFSMFEIFAAAPHASDEEWDALMSNEEPSDVEGLKGLRQSALKFVKVSTEPKERSVSVGSWKIRAQWPNDHALKWATVGLLSWFELYGPKLSTFFEEVGDALEIRWASYSDSEWAVTVYETVREMFGTNLPAVLGGMTPERRPRVTILLGKEVIESEREHLGELEVPALMLTVRAIRSLFLGETEDKSLHRFTDEFLDSNEFLIHFTGRLGTTQHMFGGYLLNDA